MAKRRTWVQGVLRYRAKDGSWRGGARPGAGRPAGKRPRVRHLSRPTVTRHTPVHVTLRLDPQVCSLRRPAAYRAIRRAMGVAAAVRDARIVHLSIQRNHVHLLVEADSATTLGEAMRRFAISAAHRLNRAAKRARGQVFTDRYHAEVITVPRQARHALAYVLNNWRHHAVGSTSWRLDPYSSAVHFRGWRELPTTHLWPLPAGYEPLPTAAPRSWLLDVGWQRHGLISLDERPGAAPSERPERGPALRFEDAAGWR